jgi:hypothetical protein
METTVVGPGVNTHSSFTNTFNNILKQRYDFIKLTTISNCQVKA